MTSEKKLPNGGTAHVAALARKCADVLAETDELPGELVTASLDAGLYRMCLPAELGGLGTPLPETVTIIETLSHANGSVGWCTTVANVGATLLGRIDETQARLIAAEPERLCIAGGFPPAGRGVWVSGGYEVTGRWSFASGCTAATWFLGGIMPVQAEPRPLVAFFPADRARIVRNWDVTGLRATGSHDIVAEGVGVPAGRTTPLVGGQRWSADPITAIPFFGLGPLLAAVPLGIARRAMDELVPLATEPDGAFQAGYAAALGRLSAARGYWLDQTRELWRAAKSDAVSHTAQANVWLAVGEAAAASVAAVRFAYEAAGSSALRSSSPIGRCLADVLAATRHIAFGAGARQVAARVFLGLPVDSPLIS